MTEDDEALLATVREREQVYRKAAERVGGWVLRTGGRDNAD